MLFYGIGQIYLSKSPNVAWYDDTAAQKYSNQWLPTCLTDYQVSVVALCAVFLVSFSTYVLYHMVKPDDGKIPHGSQHYKADVGTNSRPHAAGVGHDAGLLGWGEEQWASPFG